MFNGLAMIKRTYNINVGWTNKVPIRDCIRWGAKPYIRKGNTAKSRRISVSALGVHLRSKLGNCTDVIAILRMSVTRKLALQWLCASHVRNHLFRLSTRCRILCILTTCALSLFHVSTMEVSCSSLTHVTARNETLISECWHGPSYVPHISHA